MEAVYSTYDVERSLTVPPRLYHICIFRWNGALPRHIYNMYVKGCSKTQSRM